VLVGLSFQNQLQHSMKIAKRVWQRNNTKPNVEKKNQSSIQTLIKTKIIKLRKQTMLLLSKTEPPC